jgi:O-antigen biosynthesis protein
VTHGAVRLNLLRGNFTYTTSGLLDRTHLRFFDRAAVDTLFKAAGLDVLERLRVTRGLTETEIPIDLATFSRDVIQDVERDPESRTFQFVIVATVGAGDRQTEGSSSLAERLQQQIRDWEVRFAEVEAYARSLETERSARAAQADDAAELNRQVEELRDTLTTRMADIHVRDRELRQLQADLATKEAFATELRQTVAELESVIEDLNETLVQNRQRAIEQDAAVQAERRVLDADRRDTMAKYDAIAVELAAAHRLLSAPSVRATLRASVKLREHPRVRGLLRRMFGSMFVRG